MRRCIRVIGLLAIGFLWVGGALAQESEKMGREYIEAGLNYQRVAEASTNARDRTDNIQRAAGQFQTAANMGKDKSNWRLLVAAAEGYIRLIDLVTGNDRDNYTDQASAALDSAAKIAKDKSERQGLQAAVRVYGHLARLSGGEKLKAIEAKMQSIQKDMEGLPGPRRRPR